MASPSAEPAKHIVRRLEALDATPLSRTDARLLMLAGVSWAIHAMELVVFSFTRSLVAKDIGMGTAALEILGAGVFIGAFFGGPVFGYVADKYGRRPSLLLAMALSLVGLGLSACAQHHYEVIIGRVVAGVGLGGEIPAATVLIQELAPRTRRGSMVALLEAFSGVGGVLGVALAFGAAPVVGWRILYAVLTAFVLYAAVLRFSLPESPRWLLSKGKLDEALAVVEQLERTHHSGASVPYEEIQVGPEDATPKAQIPDVALTTGVNYSSKSSSANTISVCAELLSGRTVVLWTLWTALAVSAYALGTYVPTLISLTGFNMFAVWWTAALLQAIQVLGCILASYMLETKSKRVAKSRRWRVNNRKQTLAFFVTVAVFAALAVSYLPWTKPVVVVGTSVVAFALAGCWSAVLAYTPEHYSVIMRGRGMGYALSFSRLGAIAASFLYPRMFDVWLWSVSSIAWTFGSVLVVVVFGLVLRFGFEPTATPAASGKHRYGANDESKSVSVASPSSTRGLIDLELGSEPEDEEEFPLVSPSGSSEAGRTPNPGKKLKALRGASKADATDWVSASEH